MQKIIGIVLVAALILVESAPANEPSDKSHKSSEQHKPNTRQSPSTIKQHGIDTLAKNDRSNRHARSTPDATTEQSDVKIQPIRGTISSHDNPTHKDSDEILQIDHGQSNNDSTKDSQRSHPVLLSSTVQRQKRDNERPGNSNKVPSLHSSTRNEQHSQHQPSGSRYDHFRSPNEQHNSHQQPSLGHESTRDTPKHH